MRSAPLARASAAAVLVLLVATDAARAKEDPPEAKPPGSPGVDLDLLVRALAPLGRDPALRSVATPTGGELVRLLVSELPPEHQAKVASTVSDVRRMIAFAPTLGGGIDATTLLFRRPDDADAFVDARKTASKAEDARREPDPEAPRVLETSYGERAGSKGRFPGFTVRKRWTESGGAFTTVTEVARLGPVVVVLNSSLDDIGRPELDEALARVEAALSDPLRFRRTPTAGPVLLQSLGPTATVRAVGGHGSFVPRFSVRVEWRAGPGSFEAWGGHAEGGVAVIRVPNVEATVAVWAARSEEDEPLPWGPASAALAAGATEMEVELPDGMPLGGVARDKEGRRLEGILVAAIPAEGALGIPAKLLPPGGLSREVDAWHAHAKARTGPDGRFRLAGLGRSRYRLTVVTEEWFTTHDVEVDAGARSVELIVEAAVAVDVRVLGPDDQPVVGAVVAAYATREGERSSGSGDSFEADSNGVAHLVRLRAGENYRLTILPPKERTGVSSEVIEPWSPAPTTVRLPRK
jgi:hypothetical protein